MKLCPLGLDVFEKVRSRVPIRTAHMPLLMENELYALTSSTRLHAERGSIQAGHRQQATGAHPWARVHTMIQMGLLSIISTSRISPSLFTISLNSLPSSSNRSWTRQMTTQFSASLFAETVSKINLVKVLVSWKYLLAAIAASLASMSSLEVQDEQHIYQFFQGHAERDEFVQFCT